MAATDGNNCQQCAGEEPRANALKHGLTASIYLPQILRAGRLTELVTSLRDEYRPQTITEGLLISEIARHAAVLEVTEVAEPAIWRTAAQAISQFSQPIPGQSSPTDDVQLTAAITSESLDRAARYRRGHEKAFHQALDKLRTLQAAGAAAHPVPAPDWTEKFATEAGCEAYLKQRFLAAKWRCPQCRETKGHWLGTRQRWECGHCGAQIGLRCGTVFARSRLPLTIWFLAIRAFAARTSITAGGLMALTGVARPATAQAMLRRIRSAVAESNIAEGLAGLTGYPLARADDGTPECHFYKTTNALSMTQSGSQTLTQTPLR